jgi:hypothetical protein
MRQSRNEKHRRPSPTARQILLAAVAVLGMGLLGAVLLSPAVTAWYPTVVPNDYYEVPDSFSINGGTSTLARDAVTACLVGRSTVGECAGTAQLQSSLVSSSYWQAAAGRTFFHHSYIYVPAKHLMTYGFDQAVPYLYGYGNTLFHALLMQWQGATLSAYFTTYP